MNVLSLFDGMSCGRIALKELGITPNIYYASEIDKHAIAQTQLNFPDTVQLGSVTDVDVSKLEPIDLLIGGSPCSDLSFAGKRRGLSTVEYEEVLTLERYLELKEQGFEFEGQSYLFWEYMRILTDIRKYNPNVLFFLENVEMGKKWESVLSHAIGLYGVHINSALVSAQNRKRIYWTNIRTRKEGLFGEIYTDIPQPKDRGLFLKDILEQEVDEKYYLSEKAVNALIAHRERNKESGGMGGGHVPMVVSGTLRAFGGGLNFREIHSGKGATVLARAREDGNMQNVCIANNRIRRLTPTECSRLQTIPEWYKWKCSETQQYKMCGNGWNIETIKHIFSFMKL